MRIIVAVLSVLVMLTGTAIAQSGATSAGTVPPAPVGHRQPRASDVPSEKSFSDPNDPLSKENQALDKKIKSICRGC
jgi:hypothetical protein